MSRIVMSGLFGLAACCLFSSAIVAAETESPRAPDVVYVGSPHDIVAKMLELVKVTKDDVLYDPGCGDGRIVVAAATEKYGCKAVGFDLNPVRLRESLENIKRNGVQDLVQVERKDIFTVDFSKASVVTLYLLPWMNEKLVPQLQKMKPGSPMRGPRLLDRGLSAGEDNHDELQAGWRRALHLRLDHPHEKGHRGRGK